MKKILSLLVLMVVTATAALSQAPGIFNYQGVARNSVGNVLANQTIRLRLTIHDGTAAGPVVYQETRSVTTNPFGLFNAQVGNPVGAITQTGTVPGVPWGVGAKFIQVEIDPAGGTSFINIGTAQIASVPYALFANSAADLVLPFIKTQSAAGTLFGLTNSSATGTLGAINGTSASQDANASAVIGTISSTTPGGFSAGIRGINNGTGGLGIGVHGSQAGSGWGVYGTTPGGIGVHGNSTSGFGVYGLSTSGVGVYGLSNTGNGGLFEVTNAASTADALRATTAGTGASWAIRGISSGTNGAGLFVQTNATNAANNLQSNQAGLGRAGLFNITNAASTANAVEVNTNGTGNAIVGNQTNGGGTAAAVMGTSTSLAGNAVAVQGVITPTNPGGFSAGVRGINNGTGGLGIGVWGSHAGSGWGVYGTANAGIGVNGSASSGIGVNGTSNTGTGGRFTTTSGLALHTTGGVQLQGIGEAANRVLTSDAAGNASWQALGGGVGVGGSGTLNFIAKWTPDGSNLGNSLFFDDGTNVGLGTTTPSHRLTVNHGGSTGIMVRSSGSYSAMDIDAASGDAAIRLLNAGVTQWNIRNQPGTDNLQIFELGGGGERFVIENGTGNVSIGAGSTPAYRLDILHGGSTGIRNKSTGSYSAIDIDGASGDAALRFVNNGTNMWNLRNQPGTDNFQLFELGGGGERLLIERGSGNVSIGAGGTPTYKLDILHGGSTGIRNKSTSSYSAFDIDGATGDAAIRFANNGVNQWNVRNQPGTNTFQIFELGGGGERLSIEDATGNVSIGNATPTHKLHILHAGSSGMKVESASSFSTVDIDAFSGDAALRFQKAGTGMWNTRNNPGTDDYEIFELGSGSRFRIQDATGFVGINVANPTVRLHVGGDFTATGVKAFTIDHPLDPENKMLRHFAVESNEVMNSYSGNITTDANGKAVVQLPDYFESINKDFRYQLTVIGSFAQAIISKKINGNKFEIATNQPGIEVSWEVKGVRNDPYMQKEFKLKVEEMKTGDMKGKYFAAEAYNQPASKGMNNGQETNSSVDLSTLKKSVPKIPEDETKGSLSPTVIQTKTVPASATTGGSLEMPVTAPAKPVPSIKGTSVDEKTKPVENKKTTITDPGNTKTE